MDAPHFPSSAIQIETPRFPIYAEAYNRKMMDLLKRRDERRRRRREELREQVRQRLKEALHQLAPGEPVILFGSVTRPHEFHERSDVDIAFVEEPKKKSRYALQAQIEEMIHHPVDLIILSECRFREKIEREGEAWMN